MTEFTLSAETAARLKKVAAVKGASEQALAEQAIRRYVRDELRRMMQRESEAFRRLHAELLARYAGEYVAVYQGQVVDHGSDQLALLQRIEQRYADAPVLIRQVLPEPEEVYTLRSPRIEHGG